MIVTTKLSVLEVHVNEIDSYMSWDAEITDYLAEQADSELEYIERVKMADRTVFKSISDLEKECPLTHAILAKYKLLEGIDQIHVLC